MLWIVKYLVGQAGFDHMRTAHYHQPVGQQARYGQLRTAPIPADYEGSSIQ